MNNALQQVRILHALFVTTWFLFILVAKFFLTPIESGNPRSFFPAVIGAVVISEIGVALFLRARLIGSSEAVLRTQPEDQAALAKWRTGNLLSFCFAETITLFGLVLRVLGFEWRVAGIFFGVGLLVLLWWMPRKIDAMPRGVR